MSGALLRPAIAFFLAAAGSPGALPVTLDWRAPEGCPERSAVADEVERLASSRAPAVDALEVEIDVSRAGEAWLARLTTRSAAGRGERKLQAPSCGELAEAAALVVALALCPSAAPEPAPPAPLPPSRHAFLRPLAAADAGTLVKPSLQAGLAAAATFGPLRLEAQLARGFEQRASRGPRPESGLALQVPIAIALRGCWTLWSGAAELGACVGAEGAAIRGQGFGISDPAAASGLWLGALAEGALGLQLSSAFAVRVGAGAALALVRPTFSMDGYGEVHRPTTVAARLSAGVEVRLW